MLLKMVTVACVREAQGARGREVRSLGVTSSAPSATFVNRVVQARVDDAISPGPGTPRDLFLPFLLSSLRCPLKLPNLLMAWEWAQRSSMIRDETGLTKIFAGQEDLAPEHQDGVVAPIPS